MDSGTNQSAGVFKNVFFPGFSVRMGGLVLGCLQGCGLWQHMMVTGAVECSDTPVWKRICGHSWWDHSWASVPLHLFIALKIHFYSC